MLSFLDTIKIRLRDWFVGRAHGPHARTLLAIIAFTESFIFPIPTATFQMAILLAGAQKWLYYAIFTTIFSVLGGVVGYVIGAFFFDTIGIRIITFYGLTAELEHVRTLFEDNAFGVVFTGAFTPLPYKIFTLSAGFLKINFLAFLLASVIGRGLQFFIVSYIFKLFGARIAELFFRFFTIIIFALLAIAILVLLL
jgi:membrane protein YqaA with SNARE-associated domain